MKRKLIASLLCLCMLVSLLPAAAFATETGTDTTSAAQVTKAPLGDTSEPPYTPEQLNIAGYTVTAEKDESSKADGVTAVYNVNVTHPALLKHNNGAGTQGLWVGIGVKINTKGTSNGSGTAGQNATGSSYFPFVTDKTTFSDVAAFFKSKDWAGQGTAGYSEYGWRQHDDTYVFQWYNLADTTKYQGKTAYLVERNPKIEDGNTTYTYNVYRINFDVTEGHLVKYNTELDGGTLTVKAGNTVVANNTPVGTGTTLTVTATPNTHYQLKSLTANDVDLSTTTTMRNADITISAEFEKIKRTVTFDANGGKIDGATAKTVEVGDGDEVDIDPTMTHSDANKVFMGWGTSKDADKTVDLTATTITSDVTYYAVWKDKVSTGISAGFSWTAAEANAARIAAARVAQKSEEGLNDALDQTVWFMLNESVKGNHYWYEITDGTEAIWEGAMNYSDSDTARGMISASFLHTNPNDTENIQNPDNKQVPAQLVINVWKTNSAVTAKPDGDPTYTQTITTGTNPLKIAAVTPNVRDKTAKVTFNQDLFGRYVIELKKGNEVIAATTTECKAPGSAVAMGTGHTFDNVNFASGIYTISVYQAAAATNNTYVGSAIDSKPFEVKAETITEISTDVDGLSVAIRGTEIVLTGNMKDANATVSLNYRTSMGNSGTVNATYTAGTGSTTKGTWELGSLNLFGGTTYTLTAEVNFLAEKVDIATIPPSVSASEEIQAKLPDGYDLENAVGGDAGDVLSHSTVEALLPDSASAVSDLLGTNGGNIDNDTIPEGKTASAFTEVHVVSYFDVEVVDYSAANAAEPATITLNITPMIKRVPAIPATGSSEAVYAEFTDPNATKATKVTNYEASKPIPITVTLPTGFVNETTKDNLIAKHYADEARTTIKEWLATTVNSDEGVYTASFDATSFSPYELTVDDRTATVTYVAGEGATMPTDPAPLTEFGPSDIGYTLPVPTKGSATFDGWTMEGSSTKYKTLTEDLFNALAEAGKTVTLTANFSTGNGSNGSSGGGSSTSVSVPSASNGKVTVSNNNAKAGDTVTITLTPNTGYVVDTVTVTDAKGNTVEVSKTDDTHYTFVMPDGRVTVKATFKQSEVTPPATGFTDVAADAYYADAVKWAVDNGITNGLTATTFGPNNSCTRGQMVTFLWRAAGSPAATGTNSFSDVASGEYYYNAVLWAVEKGITNGTSATTFSPNATVNRGQTVTFLYRYAESPAATGDTSFTDVADNAFYADAVKWAVAEGITNGTSDTTFSPASNCTRGQIVTFMYRQMAE